uniref:glucosamine inositolphosphorylceramide transferase family protein n=1 Tax=Candidatus Entotheonella palauensis TaxID=93172 RepID=UPI003FA43082
PAAMHRQNPRIFSWITVEGLPVVDPTLFKYRELYWLFYTLQNDGCYGNLKLYASYATSLDALWQPHPLNPLKCDISSSRSAGNPVLINGQLYRPSQDCSETYGGAVVINQVLTLSPTAFEEVAIAHLKPNPTGPYPNGLHTLNAMEHATFVDGKRFAFDLLAWQKNAVFKNFWE